MKKLIALSVVASAFAVAGGDIAPVEPVVNTSPAVPVTTPAPAPAPAPAKADNGWKFGGQLVAYTQTVDQSGAGSLFDDVSTYYGLGAQLRAHKDGIFGVDGLTLGGEISAIDSDSNAGFYTGGGNAGTTSAGITQGWLKYNFGSGFAQVGRMQLPKSLSPFAYSEGWQIFKNTFDAAKVAFTGIQDTTVVGAYVRRANNSINNYLDGSSFGDVNGVNADDGAIMLAVQNKSIDGLTLTGNYYTANNVIDILWGDAKFKVGQFGVALQGGQLDPNGGTKGTAFGGKVSAKFGPANLMVAYSQVEDVLNGARVSNLLGTGVKSPLYTQMVLNNVGQYHANPGSTFVKLGGSVKALNGTIKAFYGMGENDNNAATDYTEFDLMYVTKINGIKLFGAYVLTNDNDVANGPKDNNFLRFWARYNF